MGGRTGALVGVGPIGDAVVGGVGGVGGVGPFELMVISAQFQNCSGFPEPVAPVGSYGYKQSFIPEARSHPSSKSLSPTSVFLYPGGKQEFAVM